MRTPPGADVVKLFFLVADDAENNPSLIFASNARSLHIEWVTLALLFKAREQLNLFVRCFIDGAKLK